MSKAQIEELNNALFKKLQELTMKIPSDPGLYSDEIDKYSKMYKEQFQKFLGDIQKKNQRFAELLIFLSRHVHRYAKKLSFVPAQVIDILKNHGPNLHPYIRKKCVGAIMILRAKNILYPIETTKFLLTLFNIEDKELRKILYKYILNDVRRMNKHHKNNKINQQIRNYIHEYLTKNGDKMAQKSLQLMIDFYKRNIWTDNRSVNAIAEGCFNSSAKVRLISAYFLIATTERLEELSESEDDDLVNPSDITFKKGIVKHTKNKEKQVEKQKRKAARRLRKKQIQAKKQNFMPIDVIYNPQDFAERLFNIMAKKNTKFAHKVIFMSLISRLTWRHRLIMLPFYGTLVKYLEPKQKEVPKVLTYFAESVHELVPDDEIEAILKHIIQKFVNDKCAEFTMTIGLNTIREVYIKLPYLMNQENTEYLCGYYDYKNKNVSMAAKALINMIRDVNPQLLPKKYRGRNFNLQNQKEQGSKQVIDGAQLLDHQGQLPIYMDKVLTDEDFKKIRRLKRKKQQELEWNKLEVLEEYEEKQGSENQEQQDEDEDQEESDDEEINLEQCEEISEFLEEGDDENEEEDDEEDQQDEEQDSQLSSEIQGDLDGQGEQLEFQDEEEKEKPKKQKTKSRKQRMQQKKEMKIQQAKEDAKKKNKKVQVQSSSDDYESQSDPNPNGFLSVNQIAFYKKTKGQIKAEKKANKDEQPKFKHKPKQKKGGSTNKQKLKSKPLMMLRAKKNKIRTQQKQVKLTIKNLKNKLGKVRSGKQAKKLKNKKIKKP